LIDQDNKGVVIIMAGWGGFGWGFAPGFAVGFGAPYYGGY
jgi:hypothetical protein